MASKIISFGFKHGTPTWNIGRALVIDVRTMFNRNPYRDRKLRYLRGTDPQVAADILKTPDFDISYADLKRIVSAHVGPVYLGCTGGHHRSVYLAERLGVELNIPVEHRDIRIG